jgi:hypothetical protein
MEEAGGSAVWSEPLVGLLFGDFYYLREGEKRGAKFVMGPRYRDVWLRNVRSMVLDGVEVRYPELAEDGHLIIKEPHGSLGAPLLMEALPESRMILLIRDPRDVVASSIDANSRGSWRDKKGRANLVGEHPDFIAEERANSYLRDAGNAKEAYDAHEGPKVLVKYEDLRAATLATMRRIYAELAIAVDDEELARVVEKHSWENIPEEEKGEGKFYRKASPGGWREDLTEEQVEVVEQITAPLLKEFYP